MTENAFSILIIDDAELNRLLLQSILEKEGYDIFLADNGIDGRVIAQQEEPDLILLDVVMPKESGFETCRLLKDNPYTADIPVIFITVLEDQESKLEGLTIGGLDYITKPFQPEEVLARVKNYLRLRHAHRIALHAQTERLRQVQVAQQAILVSGEDLPGAMFSVSYIPVLEAGGDFYDVFTMGNGVHGYFVADISGHDLSASFATSALKALIRQNCSQLYRPEETMRMINSILTEIFQPGQHLTAAYMLVDRNKNEVSIVNAAHPPTLFLPKEGEVRWLKGEGDIIGAFVNGYYTTQTYPVCQGDRLILFSDGVIESFVGDGQSRDEGQERLLKIALETRKLDHLSATERIRINLLPSHQKPEDDFLVLVVDV